MPLAAQLSADDSFRHVRNENWSAVPWSDPSAEAVFDAVHADPDYRMGPLLRRPGAALRLGIEQLLVKYEGTRLADAGLCSFKVLGVMGAMAWLTRNGGLPRRLVCASDGNFGRAVAWAAARAGIGATVYVPRLVSRARGDAIAAFGAEVIRVDGGYDRAVQAAAEAGRAPGALEMTDTGHGAIRDIPLAVQQGYGVIAEEILDQLAPDEHPPTHVFVPAGVGGFAAGLAAGFDWFLGTAAPKLITVEPMIAPCLLESLAAGALQSVAEVTGEEGASPTVMSCLVCETPSTTAWPVLRARAAHGLAIADAWAVRATRELAGAEGDPRLVAGGTGAAAYGAALAACGDSGLRDALQLNRASRVLVMVSEGATDPASYARLIGEKPSLTSV